MPCFDIIVVRLREAVWLCVRDPAQMKVQPLSQRGPD